MPEFRPYQKEDIKKLSKLKCSACLNEQRTGKTPTALMIMYVQQNKKVLIVCPSVAAYNWKEEFEKWLERPCIVLDGTPKQRQEKLMMGELKFYIGLPIGVLMLISICIMLNMK